MSVPFQTLLINMDGSPDRLATMRGHLAAAGMPFTRVPGIRGDALPARFAPLFASAVGALTTGEIGCFAAHVSVFDGMVAGRYGPVALVLEDDCEPPPDTAELVVSTLQALPADWEMVRLCNTPKRAYVPLARLPSGRRIVRYSRSPNYAGAYLVNLAGARKLLRHCSQAIPFDEYLRRPWLHGCSVYGVWPPVVTQRLDIPSCIEMAGSRQAGREGTASKAIRKLDLGNLARRSAFNIGALGPGRWLACAAINGAARLLRRRLGAVLLHRGSALLSPRHDPAILTPGDEGTQATGTPPPAPAGR